MRVIRGTGDVRKMKGEGIVSGTRVLRCMKCGKNAAPTTDAKGVVTYHCPGCGTSFKTQRM